MKVESLARPLRAHPFTAQLEPAHVEFLAGCTTNLRIAEGDYLFREGDDANLLYLLREGRMSLEIHDPARGTHVLETLHSGEVIGWATLFPPYRWELDGRVTRPTVLFAVDGVCLRGKLDEDPRFGYAFTRLLLREVHRRLERVRLQVLDVYRTAT